MRNSEVRPPGKPDVWILSHTHYHQGRRSSLSGPVRFMIEYFGPRTRTLVLQEQPMPSSDSLIPLLEVYREGSLIFRREFPPGLLNWWMPRSPDPERTYVRLKIRDLISAAFFTAIAFRFSRRANLFIGVECLNALWGRLLQLLGRAGQTVYYLFDFSPERYPSTHFNRFYLLLDRVAAYSSTATWNISPSIEKARLKMGYNPVRMRRQITVPYGLERVAGRGKAQCSEGEIKLAYAGGLNDDNGVMLLPEMLEIISGRRPEVTLTIMGSGSRGEDLRREFRARGVKERVSFLGYLPAEEVWEILRGCHLGLAPYFPSPTVKMFGDVIKIKTYLSAGLPVLTTDVPPISRDVGKEPMGEVVPYDPLRWAKAAEKLIENREYYRLCRDNALAFVRNQTWERILDRALEETLAPGGAGAK